MKLVPANNKSVPLTEPHNKVFLRNPQHIIEVKFAPFNPLHLVFLIFPGVILIILTSLTQAHAKVSPALLKQTPKILALPPLQVPTTGPLNCGCPFFILR